MIVNSVVKDFRIKRDKLFMLVVAAMRVNVFRMEVTPALLNALLAVMEQIIIIVMKGRRSCGIVCRFVEKIVSS